MKVNQPAVGALLIVILIVLAAYFSIVDIQVVNKMNNYAMENIPSVLTVVPEFRARQSEHYERFFLYAIASMCFVPLVVLSFSIYLVREQKESGRGQLGPWKKFMLVTVTIILTVDYFYLHEGYSKVHEVTSIGSLLFKDVLIALLLPALLAPVISVKETSTKD